MVAAVAVLAAACGNDDDATATTATTEATATTAAPPDGDDVAASGSITVYSGRSEELVAPIIEQFADESGIEVQVRYGDTAEMAAQILEEGTNSPACVFFGQDAGALGALSEAGRLQVLDDASLAAVDRALQAPDGTWVGVSGRARTVVYNTDVLAEDDLPDAIVDFTDPEWSGRIGWAPTNGSFQSFVTALRVLEGDAAARAWLEGIIANDVQAYDRNTSIVEAVAAGEVDVGFVNHYYLYRFLAEDPGYTAANKYYSDGDPGALVNVAGVGIVDACDQPEAAQAFVDFLLSPVAQEYFATETFEIPLVEGVDPPVGVPDLSTLTLPRIDLTELSDLDGTLVMLTEVGAI